MVTKKNKELERLVLDAWEAKRQMEALKEEYDKRAEALEAELNRLGQGSITVESHHGKVTATRVQGTRITIDEARLKKELGAQKFKKFTKDVLDKDKLEAGIALGEVDPNVVAMCSEEHMNKPYVRYSVKESPNDESTGTRTTAPAKKRSASSPRRKVVRK